MALSQLNLEPDALSKPVHLPPAPTMFIVHYSYAVTNNLELTKFEMGGKRP